jgi:hypothetical protein
MRMVQRRSISRCNQQLKTQMRRWCFVQSRCSTCCSTLMLQGVECLLWCVHVATLVCVIFMRCFCSSTQDLVVQSAPADIYLSGTNITGSMVKPHCLLREFLDTRVLTDVPCYHRRTHMNSSFRYFHVAISSMCLFAWCHRLQTSWYATFTLDESRVCMFMKYLCVRSLLQQCL